MATGATQDLNALLHDAFALEEAGDLGAASYAYHMVLALDPQNFRALIRLGFAQMRQGNFAEAVTAYQQAQATQPLAPQALSDLGVALIKLQRFEEALACYDEALANAPDMAAIHYNRSNLLKTMRRFDEALLSCEQAISLQFHNVAFHRQHGDLLKETHRFDAAIASYDRALTLKPDDGMTHKNRAMVLNRLQRFDEALASSEQALALMPDHPDALNSRGLALRGLKRYDEALACFNHILAQHPNYFEALGNRGSVLTVMGRFAEALADYNKALTLQPQSAAAHSNRGLTYVGLHQFDNALADYDQAIALKPDYHYIHASRAFIHLLLGQYEEGWKLLEWRWKLPGKIIRQDLTAPLWLGEATIAGKTILIHPEQGFGDFIQMCRYVPLLEAQQAKVVLETSLPLVSLMRSLSPNTVIVPKGEILPDYDFHCPIMSLPLAFNTTEATIPHTVPYLTADAEKCRTWEEKLGVRTMPRIGIVWSGSPTHTNDHLRSMSVVDLAPLWALPAEFHCLQKEVRANDSDQAETISNLQLHTDFLQDFSDTAALMTHMDLVISIDTSVAHLAGALGKPVWILLPSPPDYRWLLTRTDSPWYPTARLFRQGMQGGWAPVIDQVCAQCAQMLGAV